MAEKQHNADEQHNPKGGHDNRTNGVSSEHTIWQTIKDIWKWEKENFYYWAKKKYGDKYSEYKEEIAKKNKQQRIETAIDKECSYEELLQGSDLSREITNKRLQELKKAIETPKEKPEIKRCKEQQNYFSQKAGEAKKKFYRLQIWIMILALLSSFVLILDMDAVSFSIGCKGKCFYREFENVPLTKIVTGLCSGLIVLFTGIDKLKQHVQEWTKNRIASEGLKRELNLYEQGAGEYAGLQDPQKRNLFVENYEKIIAKDVVDFESNKNKIPSELEKLNNKQQKQDGKDNVITKD
jgi:hypothetical protein